MEMCVYQAGEERQTRSIERFARGQANAASRPSRNDPVSFDHHHRVLYWRATAAVDESCT
jgi:hypothetical protein